MGLLIARRPVPGQPGLREVAGTLHSMVARDANGDAYGHIDFEAVEAANRALTDIWVVHKATASAYWPEWLGSQAWAFNVEVDSQDRISALVHKASGYRRERVKIEDAIHRRAEVAINAAAREGIKPVIDLRDLVGGPHRALRLDADGRTSTWTPPPLPQFPVLGLREHEGRGR